MDLLAAYSDGSEGGNDAAPPPPRLPAVSAAPDVDTSGYVLAARGAGGGAEDTSAVVPRAAERHLLPAGARSVRHNLPLADMRAPVLGPELPGRGGRAAGGAGAGSTFAAGAPARNHRSGHVEGGFWAGGDFDRQFNAFEATGAAVDPARGEAVVGAGATGAAAAVADHAAKRQRLGGAGAGAAAAAAAAAAGGKTATALKREARERREREAEAFRALDPSVPLALTSRQPWAERQPERNVLTDEQRAFAEEHGLNVTRADRKAAARALAEGGGGGAGEGALVPLAEGASAAAARVLQATSVFHGREQADYQGRSWLQPSRAPASRRAGVWEGGESCSLPRRVVATLQAHGGGGKGAAGAGASSSAAAIGKAAAAAGKGVNCIRYFPRAGHLLLSAGLDGKVKIWDVSPSDGGAAGPGGGGGGAGSSSSASSAPRGKCMRTYVGHSKGVRDVNFSPDGARFASVGYDRVVRVWDTETGKAICSSLSGGRQFYCAVFHPERSDVLMGGCADKRIYQWDLGAAAGAGVGGDGGGGGGGDGGGGYGGGGGDGGGLVAQEYNYHLAAVNTVTFFDGGRRFVSSSDDKTLRVWEFGIPVQIKYVADPSMHAVPAACARTLPDAAAAAGEDGGGGGDGPADGTRGRLFPTHVVCQSLDNQVLTYSCAEGRFKASRKKTFRGHSTAGYACAVDCSPDGRYVASGDAEGRAFVWEWGNPARGPARTFKAHEGSVCIGAAWSPARSQLATCGWDGLVKLWE